MQLVIPWAGAQPGRDFPGYPGKVQLKESYYEITRFEFGGYDSESNEYRRINLNELINPIPLDFIHALASNQFALEPDKEFTVFFRYRQYRSWYKFQDLEAEEIE